MRYDTMLESYVLDSTATRHDMDSTAAKYLGVKTIQLRGRRGQGREADHVQPVPVERATEYAAEDADVTLRLHRALWPQIAADARAAAPVRGDRAAAGRRAVAHGAATACWSIASCCKLQSGELARRMRELADAGASAAGEPFNLDSPKQLQEILYDKLRLPVLRKTPSGQPSTAEDVLEELARSTTRCRASSWTTAASPS